MATRSVPRNKNLPEGISLLRQLNSRANEATINLGLGKPEDDMPAVLRPMAAEVMRTEKLEYTENAGDLATRDLLAQKLQVSSGKAFILAHGAQEALMAALIAILNAGDEVLVPDPGFLAYETMVKIHGGKAVPYPLRLHHGSYRHDIKAIQAKITTRTRAIIVSSPGNPTGCDLEYTELSELFKIAEKRKIAIISDEVYGMLHFTETYRPLAIHHDLVISINSFSKSHALTGFRIGYIASENTKLLQSCLVAHQYIATCASVPAQRFLNKLLQSPLYEEVSQGYRRIYQHKLATFERHSSEELKAKTPRACGGFYLFPQLPKKGQKSLPFCESLLNKENVLAIPGIVFGKKGEGSIRLSLALSDEKIQKAAEILSQYY